MERKRLWLSLSILSTGASGLIYEYLLSTVSSYIIGNSIEQFSITIALMLFFMGVAGYIQKNISDTNLILKFIGIEITLSFIGALSVLIVYYGYIYSANFYLIYYTLSAFIGFLIGLEIPIVLRINEKFTQKLKENISFIYSADFIGAFIGALVWVFVLLKFFSIIQIGFLTSLINILVALGTFLVFYKKISKNLKLIVFSLFLSIIAMDILGVIFHKKLERNIYKSLFEDPVIFHKKTVYQDIVITQNPVNKEYRLYLNGNLQFCSTDEALYHELLVHPAFSLKDSVKNVLIIGGGDGLALREVLKYPVKKVILVDLDKDMINVAKIYPLAKINQNSFFSKNVKVVNSDAYSFLDTLIKKKTKFDIIIVDLPDPSNINLAKLYSVEFYRKLYFILEFNGILTIQATSPFFAPNTFSCIKKSLKTAKFNILPYHYDIPSFGDWGFIIAYKYKRAKMVHNIQNFHLNIDNLKYLTDELFKSSLVFPKNWIRVNEKTIEANSIFNPVIIDYYRQDNIFNW